MLQLQNMQETSFVDELLPSLIWMSALYSRCNGRLATNIIVEFIKDAESVFGDKRPQSLFEIGNFTLLSSEEKQAIYDLVKGKDYYEVLLNNLEHQHHILNGYPLSFLFEEHVYGVDKSEAIDMLTEDVKVLLDRYSPLATKVQVTSLYTTLVTGRLKISSAIDLPDFNKVFSDPDSDEAKRAASFARANLNGTIGMFKHGNDDLNIKANSWVKDFWAQVFKLSECTSEY
jgi:hypothetical protein